MTPASHLISKKYARAYLRIYGAQYTAETNKQLRALSNFLTTHRTGMFYVKLSSITPEVKEEFMLRVCEQFSLKTQLAPLIRILALHDRLFLLIDIIKSIHNEYIKLHNIEEFRIMSAQPISPQEQRDIEKFLHLRTGKTITSELSVNAKLIAGLRIISNNFLWEQSISQQLLAIKALI